MEQPQTITLGDWLDLRRQMQDAEVLLEDMEIAPADLTPYWAVGAELLSLLQEVDEYMNRRQDSGPAADENALFLAMRRRLRALLATAEEIAQEIVSE